MARTRSTKLHPRQVAILEVLDRIGEPIPRPKLRKMVPCEYQAISNDCGSVIGRYLGAPNMSEGSKLQYPYSLLNRGYVKMWWGDDLDNARTTRQVLMVVITPKGRAALSQLKTVGS